MKSYRKELWFNTPTRTAFVNITGQVQDSIRESGIKEGIALINAMHITASVFINDDESGLHQDYTVWLEKLAPHGPLKQYRHNDTGEDNADEMRAPAIGAGKRAVDLHPCRRRQRLVCQRCLDQQSQRLRIGNAMNNGIAQQHELVR